MGKIISSRPEPVGLAALAFICLLFGGFAIGFAGIIMRLSDVNPLASAFWRMALAAPILWVWAFLTKTQDKEKGKRTGIAKIVWLAGIFFAGDIGIWHLSLNYTTVANATLLSNLAPIFIALWVWLVHRTTFTRIFIFGMLISLIGTGMLIGPDATFGDTKLLGDVLGLSTALFYAAYQLVVKNARDQYSTARLMAWSTTITALVLLPFALATPGTFFSATMCGWLPLIGLALIAQIGGQTTIAYAFAHLPAALSSITLLIQPLTATIAAWIILQEIISSVQILGSILLIWGIYLAKRGS